MTSDFPAAHSMDTRWFAVDADGHVAMFDSGEPGVVAEGAPHAWEKLDDGRYLAGALLDALPRTNAILTMPVHGAHLRQAWERPDIPKLVFVADAEDAARLLAQEGAILEKCDGGFAVRMAAIEPEVLAWLHDGGRCVSCRIGVITANSEDDLVLHAASQVGLFHFDHDDYSYPTPPYLRFSVPDQPVRLDALPPAFQERLGRVRLGGCFAHAPELQPAEHVSCYGWGAARLDLARRRVYPMALGQYGEVYGPGEYAHYIALAADELRARGLTWEQPTVPDPGPATNPFHMREPAPPPTPGILARLLRRLRP